MIYRVQIREEKTGVVRCLDDPRVCGAEDDTTKFLWSEGNYSCDCNRRLLFDRAAGCEDDASWAVPCTDGLFSVRVTRADGSVLYSEFNDAAPT